MKKLLSTAVLASALVTTPAVADEFLDLFTPDPAEEWSLTLSHNVFTTHRHSDGYTSKETGELTPWNEDNDLTGMKLGVNGNVGYFVGKGNNSYYEDMYIAGIEFSTDTKYVELGADLGLATGYEHLVDWGVLPFAAPFIRGNVDIGNKYALSVKAGTLNFMAEHITIELTANFF